MKFLSSMSLALIAMCSIAACGKASEQTFDVPYYKEHAEERKKKIEEYQKDPGGLGDTPNCINAEQAQLELDASRKGIVQIEAVK